MSARDGGAERQGKERRERGREDAEEGEHEGAAQPGARAVADARRGREGTRARRGGAREEGPAERMCGARRAAWPGCCGGADGGVVFHEFDAVGVSSSGIVAARACVARTCTRRHAQHTDIHPKRKRERETKETKKRDGGRDKQMQAQSTRRACTGARANACMHTLQWLCALAISVLCCTFLCHAEISTAAHVHKTQQRTALPYPHACMHASTHA